MGIGSAPKIAAPTPLPPAATPATMADPSVAATAAAARAKAQQAGAAAADSTLGKDESAQGFAAPATAQTTLLGGTR